MGIIESMRLDGKRIFVTGGARGIGKSVATAFAEAGADLAIVDVDLAEAQKTAMELAQSSGRRVIAVQTDVTDPVQVQEMVDTVTGELGGLEAAFCNAGICLNVPAEEMSYEQWRKVLDVNLTGVFLTAQAAGKIYAGPRRRLHHQYRLHVRAHCQRSAAPVCLQRVESRRDSADKVPGHRVGKTGSPGEFHQSRVYGHRADHEFPQPSAADCSVE